MSSAAVLLFYENFKIKCPSCNHELSQIKADHIGLDICRDACGGIGISEFAENNIMVLILIAANVWSALISWWTMHPGFMGAWC